MAKLLMITGLGSAEDLASNKRGAFYYTLEEFHKYWDRIDIVVPKVKNPIKNLFGNVFIHSSSWPLVFHPLFFVYKILKLHGKINFDLMTVQEFPPFYNGIGARIVSVFTKTPYVLEIMHVPGYPKAANFKERVYKLLTKLFIKFDANRAKAVRVINKKETPDFLVKAGISKNKIVYIHAFYIDLDTFKPMDAEKKYDLVFAARLEKNKGIQLLLEAVSNVKIQMPDIKLLIIGNGPLKKELLDFIDQNDLKDNVFFSGWLAAPHDVAESYRSAKVFVNPSYNEGGPRVVLEAMACGVPVVTTRVGLMPDIINDSQNGLFVDWTADDMAYKIMKLLKDTELQNKFKEAGFETVKQFERKAAIKNYAEKLQNILCMKNLLIITQKVDEDDQLLGFFVKWLVRFARKFNKITILCLEKGKYELPSNVEVITLGKDRYLPKIWWLFNFYKYIFQKTKEYDAVFVHMNPIWVVLGGPLRHLINKKIFFWYTSGGITAKLKLAEKFADVIFTASPESFRLPSKKVIVTGHGIDTELFQPSDKLKVKSEKLKILSVGRIAPVKNYETLIDTAQILKARGFNFSVTMIGEAPLERDKNYEENLKFKIKNLKLEDNFNFVGKVINKDLPRYYQSHDLFVHLSKTGSLDKSLLEAMSCGMNVLSSNDAARRFLPLEPIFDENNAQELADKIEKTRGKKTDGQLRQYVVENHNLNKLIDKIAELIINK